MTRAVDLVSLVRRAQGREDTAWQALMDRFHVAAYRAAFKRLGSREAAEDAVQEAFVEAFLDLDRLRDPRAFPGWFRMVLLQRCYLQMRRRRLATVSLEEAAEVPSAGPDPLAEALRTAERRRLLEALAELPLEQRLAVQYFHFDGCTVREISDRTGLSPYVVGRRLRAARQRMKEALQ